MGGYSIGYYIHIEAKHIEDVLRDAFEGRRLKIYHKLYTLIFYQTIVNFKKISNNICLSRIHSIKHEIMLLL